MDKFSLFRMSTKELEDLIEFSVPSESEKIYLSLNGAPERRVDLLVFEGLQRS
ncbi:hypothetical protein CPB83DRAFT_861266 [Crepidotus variabilis]|uniref:Uncharacterized protein n=1 Tax=Crepidotus variabilis TaxID=179855 RepID=A0A9P6E8L1_9AGAR|nr:hypothetical protein CPB83DRAFT_861266 [Crepidotus variabilis]